MPKDHARWSAGTASALPKHVQVRQKSKESKAHRQVRARPRAILQHAACLAACGSARPIVDGFATTSTA
jgi:hypothetical protein